MELPSRCLSSFLDQSKFPAVLLRDRRQPLVGRDKDEPIRIVFRLILDLHETPGPVSRPREEIWGDPVIARSLPDHVAWLVAHDPEVICPSSGILEHAPGIDKSIERRELEGDRDGVAVA